MSFQNLAPLRWAPLLALLYLIASHSLGGVRRTPALYCSFPSDALVIFPPESTDDPAAPVEWFSSSELARRCVPNRFALFLLDGVPASFHGPLFRAVARVHDRVAGPLRFGTRVRAAGLSNLVRVRGDSADRAAATWPRVGSWAAVHVSPPGSFLFPVPGDLDSTLGAATIEDGKLLVEWLDGMGAPRAFRCELPALNDCRPAEAAAPPALLAEFARGMKEHCDAAWRSERRPPVECGLGEVNRRLAACPGSLSRQETNQLGAAFASVPFFHWGQVEVDRMLACPAVAANEVVRTFVEMRQGKTMRW